jgi:antitoxin (DNA-binding transcriptional repressor) of toxin-antitoxin stability system
LALLRIAAYGNMSYMKIVTVREMSRHFTRHAESSLHGETVRVFREGKPYVRIIPDEEVDSRPVPKIDFAARAKEDFPNATPRSDVVQQIIRNRR